MNAKRITIFLCVIALCLFINSCAKEQTNQTPMYAAANAIRFAESGSFAQFRSMFDSLSQTNATEEIFLALGQSSTASNSQETCHFVTMENGDIWMFRFSQAKANEPWKITSIKRLSEADAETIKALLE